MVRIIATLLLLTFCITQVNCAEIQKEVLNKITITDSEGNAENIYINKKGNVKKTEEIKSENTTQNSMDNAIAKEHQKYIKEAKKYLTNFELSNIFYKTDYGYIDKAEFRSGKEYTKMKLLDGDYAIAFKGADYIAEYHKDKSIMGIVKYDKKYLTDDKASVIFYEYRFGNNTDYEIGLKHIMFLDYEKDKYISQYIYNNEGKLLCRQINNNIYIDKSSRNMIPNWSKRKLKKEAVYNTAKAERNEKIKQGLIYTAAAPFMVPAYVVFGTITVVSLPVSLPFVWFIKNELFGK